MGKAAGFAALVLPLLASCAAAGDTEAGGATSTAEGRQCFLARQANHFDADDDDTAYVHVGVRDIYRLELAGICHNVDWAQRIAIRSRSGNSWVCRGHDAELVVPSPTGPERCLVTEVAKLSETEVQAYRDRRRK
jgi:hypothetical protein